jgi:hypothetical protein
MYEYRDTYIYICLYEFLGRLTSSASAERFGRISRFAQRTQRRDTRATRIHAYTHTHAGIYAYDNPFIASRRARDE